ncbi:hypothetical protein D9M72_318420 [compost metagenome]
MLGDALLEVGQRLLALRGQADRDEHVEPQAQRLGVRQRHITVDHAAGLQHLHARQAGRGRQVHAARQFDVRQGAVALQLVENAQVDGVEFHEIP